jgi:hypothetical protein
MFRIRVPKCRRVTAAGAPAAPDFRIPCAGWTERTPARYRRLDYGFSSAAGFREVCRRFEKRRPGPPIGRIG